MGARIRNKAPQSIEEMFEGVSTDSTTEMLRNNRTKNNLARESLIKQKELEESLIKQKELEESLIKQKEVEESLIKQKEVEESLTKQKEKEFQMPETDQQIQQKSPKSNIQIRKPTPKTIEEMFEGMSTSPTTDLIRNKSRDNFLKKQIEDKEKLELASKKLEFESEKLEPEIEELMKSEPEIKEEPMKTEPENKEVKKPEPKIRQEPVKEVKKPEPEIKRKTFNIKTRSRSAKTIEELLNERGTDFNTEAMRSVSRDNSLNIKKETEDQNKADSIKMKSENIQTLEKEPRKSEPELIKQEIKRSEIKKSFSIKSRSTPIKSVEDSVRSVSRDNILEKQAEEPEPQESEIKAKEPELKPATERKTFNIKSRNTSTKSINAVSESLSTVILNEEGENQSKSAEQPADIEQQAQKSKGSSIKPSKSSVTVNKTDKPRIRKFNIRSTTSRLNTSEQRLSAVSDISVSPPSAINNTNNIKPGIRSIPSVIGRPVIKKQVSKSVTSISDTNINTINTNKADITHEVNKPQISNSEIKEVKERKFNIRTTAPKKQSTPSKVESSKPVIRVPSQSEQISKLKSQSNTNTKTVDPRARTFGPELEAFVLTQSSKSEKIELVSFNEKYFTNKQYEPGTSNFYISLLYTNKLEITDSDISTYIYERDVLRDSCDLLFLRFFIISLINSNSNNKERQGVDLCGEFVDSHISDRYRFILQCYIDSINNKTDSNTKSKGGFDFDITLNLIVLLSETVKHSFKHLSIFAYNILKCFSAIKPDLVPFLLFMFYKRYGVSLFSFYSFEILSDELYTSMIYHHNIKLHSSSCVERNRTDIIFNKQVHKECEQVLNEFLLYKYHTLGISEEWVSLLKKKEGVFSSLLRGVGSAIVGVSDSSISNNSVNNISSKGSNDSVNKESGEQVAKFKISSPPPKLNKGASKGSAIMNSKPSKVFIRKSPSIKTADTKISDTKSKEPDNKDSEANKHSETDNKEVNKVKEEGEVNKDSNKKEESNKKEGDKKDPDAKSSTSIFGSISSMIFGKPTPSTGPLIQNTETKPSTSFFSFFSSNSNSKQTFKVAAQDTKYVFDKSKGEWVSSRKVDRKKKHEEYLKRMQGSTSGEMKERARPVSPLVKSKSDSVVKNGNVSRYPSQNNKNNKNVSQSPEIKKQRLMNLKMNLPRGRMVVKRKADQSTNNDLLKDTDNSNNEGNNNSEENNGEDL